MGGGGGGGAWGGATFAAPESVPSKWRRSSPSFPPPDLPRPGRVNSTLQPTSPPPRSPVPTSLDSSGRIRPREYPGSRQTARPLDTLPPGLRPRWGCRVPKEARVQRLENDRCPEGGLELQVTGAGPRGQRALRRCPFPALPRADLLRPRAGCALGDSCAPSGRGGQGEARTPNAGRHPDALRSSHSHRPVPDPSSGAQRLPR